MSENYGQDDRFANLHERARASREAVAARLGERLPTPPEKLEVSSDWDPCAGWFAAANLAYSLANTAPDINSAIEWTVTGDWYQTAGENCQAIVKGEGLA